MEEIKPEDIEIDPVRLIYKDIKAKLTQDNMHFDVQKELNGVVLKHIEEKLK